MHDYDIDRLLLSGVPLNRSDEDEMELSVSASDSWAILRWLDKVWVVNGFHIKPGPNTSPHTGAGSTHAVNIDWDGKSYTLGVSSDVVSALVAAINKTNRMLFYKELLRKFERGSWVWRINIGSLSRDLVLEVYPPTLENQEGTITYYDGCTKSNKTALGSLVSIEDQTPLWWMEYAQRHGHKHA